MALGVHPVGVEVDSPLAYLARVIGVALQRGGLYGGGVVAAQLFGQRAVFRERGFHVAAWLVPGLSAIVGADAYGVVFVEGVAYGQAGIEVFLLHHLVYLAGLPPGVLQVSHLLNALGVWAGPFRGAERGADVKPAHAIVHVEIVGTYQVAIVVQLAKEPVIQAEALAHGLFRGDTDNGGHAGVISGTGIGDDLHLLDIVRAEPVQFRVVSHLASVYVNLGRSPAKHLYLALARRYVRDAIQQVFDGAGVFQYRAAHARHHAFSLEAGAGQVTFHYHLTQHLRHGFQPQGTQVSIVRGIDSLVTQ